MDGQCQAGLWEVANEEESCTELDGPEGDTEEFAFRKFSPGESIMCPPSFQLGVTVNGSRTTLRYQNLSFDRDDGPRMSKPFYASSHLFVPIISCLQISTRLCHVSATWGWSLPTTPSSQALPPPMFTATGCVMETRGAGRV